MPRADVIKPVTPRLVQIAAAMVVIFAFRNAKEVLIPIALAVLFAFLLAPLVTRVERLRIGRAASVLLVALFAFAILGGIGVVVGDQLRDLTNKLPVYTETIEKGFDRLRSHGGMMSNLSRTAERLSHDMSASQPSTRGATAQQAANDPAPTSQPMKVEVISATPPALEMAYSTFGPVLDLLATAFIVIVLCIFMLIDREGLRDRVIRLVSHGHLNVTTQAMDDAANRVSRYLEMQALTNGSYAILVSLGLYFIGVPNPILWGMLAGLLRFLPYVGPWLGASIPTLLAFVTLGATRGFMTVGMYVSLEVVVSSVVEPWLYGAHTGVSSIAILIAAIFWAWVWGGVGLLLATPLTVLLVVVGKYVPQLEFLSVMLGDEPVFDRPTRYYQRLLASDQEEADDLVEEFLKDMPADELYEAVLIPALAVAHRDRFSGRLDQERFDYIRSVMKEQIEEVSDAGQAQQTKTKSTPNKDDGADSQVVQRSRMSGAEKVQILCLPARDESDEIAGMMFAQVLERQGFKAEAVSVTALASEMIGLVEQKKADIVVLTALPPSAVAHARYLVMRLRRKFPELRIVVGLWTAKSDMVKAKARISQGDTDPVVTSFSAAVHEIEQLAHPLLLAKSNQEIQESKTAINPNAPTTELAGAAAV